MKVFIYAFITIYIALLSKSIFYFLFDKYINHIINSINFFAPIKTSVVVAIIIYFVRLIFPKE
ncbi:hypothetical protein QV08_09100 [Gallibacterium salpingitidis]|uniref:Uncharacterized protein n=1 Tax=Gallibacterium salpingitidis TaxID=505341 RepID=A0AB36E352_9PAST|nr:hypothetical protein QV08_09100 [Gallibacterium salpingitidis]OBX06880.1 hypothetical protein QV09_11655 [Gallibacterium salpingitidis]